MLTVHQLAKSFALTTLFENVTFTVNPGDRVALVGPSGCGKTTLLRIILGEVTPDFGHISLDPSIRIGYLSQGISFDDHATFGEAVGKIAGDIAYLESELAELASEIAVTPEDINVQLRYDEVLNQIGRHSAGYVSRILEGLELDDIPEAAPVSWLSGGQLTRLNLALVLLEAPQLLLLDEPTNHLDISMLEWLEEWLSEFNGGALVVSHDRTFLDNTVSRILAFDTLKHAVRQYVGNYSDYEEQIRLEREKQWGEYRDQQAEQRRIREDILRAKAQAAYTERQASSVRIGGEMMKLKGYKDYQQGIAKKVAKKAKSRERKLERFLDSDGLVEKPGQNRSIRLDFSDTLHLGRSVVMLSDLSVGYEVDQPLLENLNLQAEAGARIVLTGPNGSGKTTLLRTIAGQLPPLTGTVKLGPSVQYGIVTQDQSDIPLDCSPLATVRHAFADETAARTFLGFFLFTRDEPLLENRSLSYGQRARLALAQIIVSGCNVLLLDEPINHLDIAAREKFETALGGFTGTIIAVIHDRHFISRFATEIWQVQGRGIRRVIV